MKKFLATLTLIGAVVASPLTVLAAPQTMPDGTVFDAEYYAQSNPDVVAVLGTDAGVLYQHYVNFGKKEGRLPYAKSSVATTNAATMTLSDGTVFDPVYYAQSNPDVVGILGTDANTLAQHYIQFGKKEGRKPSAGGVTTNTTTVATPAVTGATKDTLIAKMNSIVDTNQHHPSVDDDHAGNSWYGEVDCAIGHDLKYLPYDFDMQCTYSKADGSLVMVDIQCLKTWYTVGEADANGRQPVYWHSDQVTDVVSGDNYLTYKEYANDLSLRTTLTWDDCVKVVDMAMAYHEGKISLETFAEYNKALGIRGGNTLILYNKEAIYDTRKGVN